MKQPLPGSPTPPPQLREEYRDWAWTVAYQYGPETLVYRVVAGGSPRHSTESPVEGGALDTRFIKLGPTDHHPGLSDEARRLRWAAGYLPVPRVIGHGSDGTLSWLITQALPGVDATAPQLRADPDRLVPMLARGLRRFHEAPVEACPFDFRLPQALKQVRDRLARSKIDPARDFHPEFAHLSAQRAVEELMDGRPETEDLVVCHGDYCLPNVLVSNGEVVGFVDLGELGVADRWWDLAVATWSLTWNLGPGYEDQFLGEYGVERDDDRMAFYRLLYDLVS